MERVWEESDSLPSLIHFKSHQGHGLPLSWHFRQAVCVVACAGLWLALPGAPDGKDPT